MKLALFNSQTGDACGVTQKFTEKLAVDGHEAHPGPLPVGGSLGQGNLAVVDTTNTLLVFSRSEARGEAMGTVERQKTEGAPVWVEHRTVHRPWGNYTILEHSEIYQVKRITVSPGHRLSLQSHRCRSEQWVVVQGEALVTVDEYEIRLFQGESVHIPVGVRHRLTNTGQEELQLIEVQSGDYLGEDDIVRYTDDYGRECL